MNLRPQKSKEVNLDLTPLIDVVFLLLIFFMVSTTFDKQTELQVNLPEASEQEKVEKKAHEIRIQIDIKGQFYVNDEELVTHDLETLKRAIKKASDGDNKLPVIIESDKQAPFQSAITVMDAAGQLGLLHLSFAADQSEE